MVTAIPSTGFHAAVSATALAQTAAAMAAGAMVRRIVSETVRSTSAAPSVTAQPSQTPIVAVIRKASLVGERAADSTGPAANGTTTHAARKAQGPGSPEVGTGRDLPTG